MFDAWDTHLKNIAREFPVPPGRALLLGLSLWYTWALLSLVAMAYVRRFPLTRTNWWQRLPLAVGFAVLLALVKLALDYPSIEAFCCPVEGLMPFDGFYRMAFAGHFQGYVFIAIGMLGVIHAWTYFREHQERHQEARQLEERLADSQRRLLSSQLHPHFLFNTLNAISYLIRHDPDEADRVLARLGDLLRHLLDASEDASVSLAQEIAFVRAYLDIEQARFGGRLEVCIDIEPGLEEVPVPPLILQPLVENAVHHGMAPSDGPGVVAVRARREEDRLRLEVWNEVPGPALPRARDRRKSLGLAATRARLARQFGDSARLDLCRDGTEAVAVLEIPCPGTPASLAAS
jgi:two-component sensor histidine kinase